ncbi:NADP-dependent oxidoreductase [Dietzia psychralcaliphila]|uniref:Alcohol dehydrogenase n=1 Tax=Dietzia psychralcaliphila TaxID=139021 RepID=A0AAD0NP27_9ACTN|nr:NADP-dependent oxidoreductase [Dietzia psychralcaliphila]AWH96417.1 alcohol dehydrogenase [Dietzia psychralcaliphila]PTM90449.1 NADPH:quinone reductase-like Zn-dependent oxidoreductase [Dietzia psychralcaliphila]
MSVSAGPVRAVGVTTYGGPDALQVVDVPAQELGPTDVRVRVTAATINPTDTYTRNGSRSKTGTPRGAADVPGMDIAGTLVEIGDDAETSLAVGDRVIGIVVPRDEHGAYREDIVLPAQSIAASPRDADDVAASTLPMNGLTARRALDLLDLQPGQTLAVTGAAGSTGGYVVQLAKHAGLTVVADASEADEELVRSLGADRIVRRGDGVADRILELYPDGVDGLFDGAVQDAAVLPAVKTGGGVATVRWYQGDGSRDLTVHAVSVADMAEEQGKLDELRQLAEDGVVTLRVADSYSPDDAGRAHERLEAGGTRGRLVIDFTR